MKHYAHVAIYYFPGNKLSLEIGSQHILQDSTDFNSGKRAQPKLRNRASPIDRPIWFRKTLLLKPNNQLNVCTTSVTEGEVAGVKLV